jgi:hypothetical protein
LPARCFWSAAGWSSEAGAAWHGLCYEWGEGLFSAQTMRSFLWFTSVTAAFIAGAFESSVVREFVTDFFSLIAWI